MLINTVLLQVFVEFIHNIANLIAQLVIYMGIPVVMLMIKKPPFIWLEFNVVDLISLLLPKNTQPRT